QRLDVELFLGLNGLQFSGNLCHVGTDENAKAFLHRIGQQRGELCLVIETAGEGTDAGQSRANGGDGGIDRRDVRIEVGGVRCVNRVQRKTRGGRQVDVRERDLVCGTKTRRDVQRCRRCRQQVDAVEGGRAGDRIDLGEGCIGLTLDDVGVEAFFPRLGGEQLQRGELVGERGCSSHSHTDGGLDEYDTYRNSIQVADVDTHALRDNES